MGATLDGRVEATAAVFEAKFMLRWTFSEEAAAEKYMAQLQHNMWVVASQAAVLSVITGGGKWMEMLTHADPLYQHLIVTAEWKFWRCGWLPRQIDIDKVSDEEIQDIVITANLTPRKCLGFKTPFQATSSG
jgi:hypothetical protein